MTIASMLQNKPSKPSNISSLQDWPQWTQLFQYNCGMNFSRKHKWLSTWYAHPDRTAIKQHTNCMAHLISTKPHLHHLEQKPWFMTTLTHEHHVHHTAQMHTTSAQHYNTIDAYDFLTPKQDHFALQDPINYTQCVAKNQPFRRQI